MIILHKNVMGASEGSLNTFTTKAKRAAGLRGSVSVLLTNSRELRVLNRQFRGKDKPTDVLSFPSEVVGARRFVGDVAISVEIAAQNAKRLGHSTADEVKILILHGLLHLAGYDHEADHGEMARTEERLRYKLGLPVGLIARASASEGSVNPRVSRRKAQSSRKRSAAGRVRSRPAQRPSR
jgi:probable rRNA maturation factor